MAGDVVGGLLEDGPAVRVAEEPGGVERVVELDGDGRDFPLLQRLEHQGGAADRAAADGDGGRVTGGESGGSGGGAGQPCPHEGHLCIPYGWPVEAASLSPVLPVGPR